MNFFSATNLLHWIVVVLPLAAVLVRGQTPRTDFLKAELANFQAGCYSYDSGDYINSYLFLNGCTCHSSCKHCGFFSSWGTPGPGTKDDCLTCRDPGVEMQNKNTDPDGYIGRDGGSCVGSDDDGAPATWVVVLLIAAGVVLVLVGVVLFVRARKGATFKREEEQEGGPAGGAGAATATPAAPAADEDVEEGVGDVEAVGVVGVEAVGVEMVEGADGTGEGAQ